MSSPVIVGALYALNFQALADQLPGQDLAGNTFWVFRQPGTNKLRRIAKFDPGTHFDEVKVTRESHPLRRMRAGLATAACILYTRDAMLTTTRINSAMASMASVRSRTSADH